MGESRNRGRALGELAELAPSPEEPATGGVGRDLEPVLDAETAYEVERLRHVVQEAVRAPLDREAVLARGPDVPAESRGPLEDEGSDATLPELEGRGPGPRCLPR
jgi:hypothetical protein